jgi:GAF domain-containing protein
MEPLPETRQALDELSAIGDTTISDELDRIAREVTDLVPECVGVSLGLHVEELTFTAVSTSPAVGELDTIQYLDDGPCVAAVREGDIVAASGAELLDEGRWLLYARAQAVHGVASSLSLPIMRRGQVVAGVNLYASTSDAFDGHHEELAAICRAWAPGIVTNADLSFLTREEARQTPARMREQDRVDIAVGMLSASLGVGVDEAAERLREASERGGITEGQAADIVIQVLSGG